MFIVHYNRELILVHYLVFTFDDNHKFPKKKIYSNRALPIEIIII